CCQTWDAAARPLGRPQTELRPTALLELLDAARQENLSVLEALERLLGLQASASAARRADNDLRFASLPAPWSLEDYDLSAQPGLEEAVIRELASLRFLDDAINVIFIGSPASARLRSPSAWPTPASALSTPRTDRPRTKEAITRAWVRVTPVSNRRAANLSVVPRSWGGRWWSAPTTCTTS